MKIIPIFAERLSAFHYDSEEVDEITRLFRIWNDPEFLEEFFNQNEDDLLSGFFDVASKQDAILLTRNEAKRFENELKRFSKNPDQSLDEIFEPLDYTKPRGFSFLETKAKGDQHKSWLRIYALKIDKNVYAITGGAIKLTEKMLDRKHTIHELEKLKRCQDYLKEEGITDIDGFKEICL